MLRERVTQKKKQRKASTMSALWFTVDELKGAVQRLEDMVSEAEQDFRAIDEEFRSGETDWTNEEIADEVKWNLEDFEIGIQKAKLDVRVNNVREAFKNAVTEAAEGWKRIRDSRNG